eukprot:EG_transcript_4571
MDVLLFILLTTLALTPQASRTVHRWARIDAVTYSPYRCVPNSAVPEYKPRSLCFAEADARIRRMEQRRLKAYPISFCYPRQLALHYHRLLWNATKTRVVTEGLHSVRGQAGYGLDDEGAYLARYAAAHFVTTRRKAGWDCMRHLEILAAGSIPVLKAPRLALDELTLFHYPKECLYRFNSAARHVPFMPTAIQQMRGELRQFFLAHLTCDRMARFALRSVGLDPCRDVPVLFLDATLPSECDYQATSVVIGLRDLLGPNLHVWREPKYLYSNWAGDHHQLYGNGFSYAFSVDGKLLSDDLTDETVVNRLRQKYYRAVVYGDYVRSLPFWDEVVAALPANRILAVHGGDLGAFRDDGRGPGLGVEFHLSGRAANATVFVREMASPHLGCPRPAPAAADPSPRRCRPERPPPSFRTECLQRAARRIHTFRSPYQVWPVSYCLEAAHATAANATGSPPDAFVTLDEEAPTSLEALARGALPRWSVTLGRPPRARDRFELFHHPQECFPAYRRLAPGAAAADLREESRQFVQSHLSCSAMVEFMLRATGVDPCPGQQWLFVEAPEDPMSVLVLSGLRQVLPGPVDVWRSGPGLSDGTLAEAAGSRAASPSGVVRARLKGGHYAGLVYGDFGRQPSPFLAEARALPRGRVWGIVGSGPPVSDVRAQSVVQFVRELRLGHCFAD